MGREDICYVQAWELIRADNWAAAVGLLEEAAQLGHGGAMADLGYAYLNGKGIPQDAKEAVRWFRKGIQQENACAYYNLGCCTEYGDGTFLNWNQARILYEKAAKLGYPQGYVALGRMHEKGKGGLKNLNKALDMYNMAKYAGFGGAESHIRRVELRMESASWDVYCEAEDLREEKKPKEAFQKLLLSAQMGYPIAQKEVGIAYLAGDCVPQDEAEGAAWLMKAAQAQDPDAEGRLGLCYLHGVGVPQDHTKAFEMFQRANEIGTRISTFYLGYFYEHGLCVPRNIPKALELYRESASMGNKDAEERIRQLEKRM